MKTPNHLSRFLTLFVPTAACVALLWSGAAPVSSVGAAMSAPPPAGLTPAETAVADTYRAWLKDLSAAHGNPTPMLKYYAPDAILVATYSPTLLHNDNGELTGYFKKFTSLPNIQGKTMDLQTRVYGDWAINTGLYTFTYDSPDGSQVVVPARFTYVYRKVGDKWLIVDHHSSLVPPSL